MTTSAIRVQDMHCAACGKRIRSALASLSGIHTTHVNPARRLVVVEHEASLDPLTILENIETAGFTPTLTPHDDHDAAQKALLKRLGIAGLAMMQVMMAAIALYAGAFDGIDDAYRRLLELTSLVFCIPVVSYSAMPFFENALRVLREPRRGINMDVPIALAIAIAFVTSLAATLSGEGHVYYDSVVMFTFLLLGARYIDQRLRRRFDVTGELLAALPATAQRLAGNVRESVPVAGLAPGDRVWVGEGAQLPVDGALVSGRATLDEALLTGESDWVHKRAGEPVYAGTLNRGAGFEMEATAAYDASRIADIAALADRAEITSMPAARLADRVAGVFVPTILAIAATTWLVWHFVDPDRALLASLTVLVVSCPCALSLAVPAALTAAMARLRQLGIVLTRGAALEEVLEVDRIFLDKTGTLTVHEPEIERIEVLNPAYTEAQCLALAGALQRHSGHPYARAFPAADATSVGDVRVVSGRGVEGTVAAQQVRIGAADFALAGQPESTDDRAVYLAVDGIACARFFLTDRIRADAGFAIESLKRHAVTPVMLSGDSHERCAATAQRLGIDYLARQTPESKLRALDEAKAAGHRVLMVGDGINDVPVLAGADVSAAMVEASDLVKSRADVLLLTRRLRPLVDLFGIARATRRITLENLGWALVYNAIAIPVAAIGLMPPWLAALGMATSSTLVMLNAARLLSVRSFGAP